MAEQTLGDRDERLAANFDGTEFTECFPTSQGVSFRSKLGTAASRDLLGTVSQSGGVPTGAIIERDSNANGEYVRFADGTMICTQRLELGADFFNSYTVFGYRYTGEDEDGVISGQGGNIPHPANFVAMSRRVGSMSMTSYIGESGADSRENLSRLYVGFSSSSNSWTIHGEGAFSPTKTFTTTLMAIGRWF